MYIILYTKRKPNVNKKQTSDYDKNRNKSLQITYDIS